MKGDSHLEWSSLKPSLSKIVPVKHAANFRRGCNGALQDPVSSCCIVTV